MKTISADGLRTVTEEELRASHERYIARAEGSGGAEG